EWGFLERVSTGLYALSLGAEHLAFPLLRSAEGIFTARAVSNPSSDTGITAEDARPIDDPLATRRRS
ncbi:MAG: hypothetical protein M3070_07575, partial [Actinomycetota bacterium]|nr:hypothetical protein [Actinomycetota bacterium]